MIEIDNGNIRDYLKQIWLDKSVNVSKRRWKIDEKKPFVKQKEDKLTCEYEGRGLSLRVNRPVSKNLGLFYYEIKLNKLVDKGSIVIGLGKYDFPLNKLPGQTRKTGFNIGFSSNGEVHLNKKVMTSFIRSKEDDVIGCGVNMHERRVFFTFNGVKLPIDFVIFEGDETMFKMPDLYAIGGVQGEGVSLTFNFGAKDDFMYDIDSEIEAIENKIFMEINKVDTSPFDINEMVMNYLSHNCYVKSLLSFKNDLNYDSTVDSLIRKTPVFIGDGETQEDQDEMRLEYEDGEMEIEELERKMTHEAGILDGRMRIDSCENRSIHNVLLRKLSTASGIKENMSDGDDICELRLSRMISEFIPNDLDSVEARTVFKDMIENLKLDDLKNKLEENSMDGLPEFLILQIDLTQFLATEEIQDELSSSSKLCDSTLKEIQQKFKKFKNANFSIVDKKSHQVVTMELKKIIGMMVLYGFKEETGEKGRFSSKDLERDNLKMALWLIVNSFCLAESGYFEKSSLEVVLNHMDVVKDYFLKNETKFKFTY